MHFAEGVIAEILRECIHEASIMMAPCDGVRLKLGKKMTQVKGERAMSEIWNYLAYT